MAKILVADDEEDVRNLLVTIFRNAGYGVWSAKNSKEAVELDQEQKPDLIFQ
jgi:CheY-like chemotaxis protein